MATISFYFDEMMPRATAQALTQQGYTVIMANDVAMTAKSDPEHLAFATEKGHLMVTFDHPFAGVTSKSTEHGGLICLSGRKDDYGNIIRKLSVLALTIQEN